jgi:FtsP/CotA-like multicopper oxidase with cupredoxin domain
MLLIGNIFTANAHEFNEPNTNELIEPPVFESNKHIGILDLLMIAKPTAIKAIPYVTGWAYEICERKNSIGDTCIPGKSNANPYGGARLQLNAGDTLKVHFINKLPAITDSDNSEAEGEQFLALNPTNIHTHGMLVSPSTPSDSTKPYGDNIFVLTFNSANGKPNLDSSFHIHGAVNTDWTDYQITLPAHHPSGLFWFHPHAHGISLNQVSAGLSGIITVGQVSDYVKGLPDNVAVRHLILKDTQVNSDNTLKDQEDPAFCDKDSSSPSECDNSGGGKWYFTVNGQRNPTINVKPSGEIWRITNASGSATYDLQLTKKSGGSVKPASGMVMQLLSIDGISVTPSRGTAMGDFKQIGGAKFKPVACPGVKSDSPAAICANKLHMMPSSRAEVWVVNRDSKGNIVSGDGSQAAFETAGYSTGIDADNWPAVELAQVNFNGKDSIKHPPVLSIEDDKHDKDGLNYAEIAKDLAIPNAAVNSDSTCQSLPKGWKRRIYFGYPTPDDFGLGLELVDEKGKPVPGSFQDVAAFPAARQPICLPLGSGNTPVNERWEVINLTSEDHNFHIHQTKFRVLTQGEIAGTDIGLSNKSVLQDSVPLLAGGQGCDGTFASWQNGTCQTSPINVEIPFAIAGDFVYHCHILEHEDGGMMEMIRVVSSSDSAPDRNVNNQLHSGHHH